MTFENTAKGKLAVSSPTYSDPPSAVTAFISRLRDSVTGLRMAADLVDEEALTQYIAGLVERREEALDSLVALTADHGIQKPTDSTGTLTEAMRRGWMRLEDSISGDDASVVGTAIAGEQDLVDEINELLSLDLPTAIADDLRSLASEVGSDVRRLSEWRDTSVTGETR